MFEKCEFCEKWDFEIVNFLDKLKVFAPVCLLRLDFMVYIRLQKVKKIDPNTKGQSVSDYEIKREIHVEPSQTKIGSDIN